MEKGADLKAIYATTGHNYLKIASKNELEYLHSKKLLFGNETVDNHSTSLLHAHSSNKATLKFILERLWCSVDILDECGNTPLHAFFLNLAKSDQLNCNDIDDSWKNNGSSLLSCFQLHLVHGGKLSWKMNHHGQTAFDLLCESKYQKQFLKFIGTSLYAFNQFSADLKKITQKDFTINVTDDNSHMLFSANKNVLRVRSGKFKAMLEHDMKESITSQARIKEISPEIYKLFDDYIQLGIFPANFDNYEDALRLYEVADEYLCDPLKFLLKHYLMENLDSDNSLLAFRFARKHDQQLVDLAEIAMSNISNRYNRVLQKRICMTNNETMILPKRIRVE